MESRPVSRSHVKRSLLILLMALFAVGNSGCTLKEFLAKLLPALLATTEKGDKESKSDDSDDEDDEKDKKDKKDDSENEEDDAKEKKAVKVAAGRVANPTAPPDGFLQTRQELYGLADQRQLPRKNLANSKGALIPVGGP